MNKKSSSVRLFVLVMLASFMAPVAGALDTDGDGIDDVVDNCSQAANPGQIDADGDGFGNLCDADINNDQIVNVLDLGLFKLAFFTTDAVSDFNVDGIVNVIDLGIMKAGFFSAPGPGAVTPTYTADAQPIFASKCAPCHTGLGLGGHDIGTTYSDAFLTADDSDCDGLNKGQCTIVLIQSGDMPNGAGCSGNPLLDAGNDACLTQQEQDLIQAWIDAGLPE